MPADHPRRVFGQEQFESLRREPPVVAGEAVLVKVERAGQQQDAVGAQHAVDLLEADPEAADVLKGVEGDHRADRGVRLRQALDVGHAIDPRPGAEIDAAVQGALYAAYSEKKPLSTQLLLDALSQTVPLSTTRAEEIAALREWARTRAVAASLGEGSASKAC